MITGLEAGMQTQEYEILVSFFYQLIHNEYLYGAEIGSQGLQHAMTAL